jgi:hypothetical protein
MEASVACGMPGQGGKFQEEIRFWMTRMINPVKMTNVTKGEVLARKWRDGVSGRGPAGRPPPGYFCMFRMSSTERFAFCTVMEVWP